MQLDAAAGLEGAWRPLSLSPTSTWNSLFSLSVPLAVLLTSIQLPREERYKLLTVIIALGVLSGCIGLLQTAGPANGSLYLYDITNGESAVGLFANRNHAGVFIACLFPMLAVYASLGSADAENQGRKWASILLGIFLIPLVLITGSRAGLLGSVLALLTVPLLYRPPQAGHARAQRARAMLTIYGAGIAAITALVLLVSLFAKDLALARLLASDTTEERRSEIWGPVTDQAWQYFPWGSGVGSYIPVFQVNEPDAVLSLNYSNHAHNDLLETLMTGGLPAALLLCTAALAIAWRSFRMWSQPDLGRRQMRFARLGSAVLVLLSLASVSDYPLRVPSLMCVAVIAAIWLSAPEETEQ